MSIKEAIDHFFVELDSVNLKPGQIVTVYMHGKDKTHAVDVSLSVNGHAEVTIPNDIQVDMFDPDEDDVPEVAG